MQNPCVVAAIHVLGLGVFWAAAIWLCVDTGGYACIAALVAAGIVTAFAIPSFLRAYNRCRAGN